LQLSKIVSKSALSITKKVKSPDYAPETPMPSSSSLQRKMKRVQKIHIVQTAGVSDSKETNPFPEFRMFDIKDLTNLAILHDNPKFLPYLDKYNPEWDGYKDVIEKI
jgi:hypothetical protein